MKINRPFKYQTSECAGREVSVKLLLMLVLKLKRIVLLCSFEFYSRDFYSSLICSILNTNEYCQYMYLPSDSDEALSFPSNRLSYSTPNVE